MVLRLSVVPSHFAAHGLVVAITIFIREEEVAIRHQQHPSCGSNESIYDTLPNHLKQFHPPCQWQKRTLPCKNQKNMALVRGGHGI